MGLAALSLFVPGEGDDPGSLTLRQAYERFYKPDKIAEGAAAGTLEAYETALKHWERFTKNPPLSEIDKGDASRLRDAMIEQSMAPATIRKYWAHLRAILRRVARPETGNPRGEGIIERVPYVVIPKSKSKRPRLVTQEEVNRLYDACRVAAWPLSARTGIPAPALWRCYLVMQWNYGPRSQDLWRLAWEGIDWELGRIYFCARKTDKSQGLPMNPAVRTHLERIKRATAFVFQPTKGKHQFHREWAKINASAGISRPVQIKQLRETCASNYEAISPGAAAWILGHSPRGTTATWYTCPTPQLIDAVARLPQPAAFLEAPPANGETQLSLF